MLPDFKNLNAQLLGVDAKKKQEKLATSEQCSGCGHGHGQFMEERKRTTCGGPASTSSSCRIVSTPDYKDVGMDLNFNVGPGYGHDFNGQLVIDLVMDSDMDIGHGRLEEERKRGTDGCGPESTSATCRTHVALAVCPRQA